VGWQQAHSKLRNCFYLAEGGQKDQQDWMIIFFHLPKARACYIRAEGGCSNAIKLREFYLL